MKKLPKIAILGGGNIGLSLAKGLVKAGKYKAKDIIITRRSKTHLDEISKAGFTASGDNASAVAKSDLIIIAVLPQQLNDLLKNISLKVDSKRHLVVSIVSGVNSKDICRNIFKEVQVVRAMPNTAIAIGESMTCIASSNASRENLHLVKFLFESVGQVIEIQEELMTSATALNACGIAFFLRAIRAASQGGVQIGFHAEEALKMASQTAKGAAALLLHSGAHPEGEIDKVTSPEGCTIAGLNEMEHQGFSSAMIKGITTSAQKASGLYKKE
jgi:pyrroline-5-carboxylate reductase